MKKIKSVLGSMAIEGKKPSKEGKAITSDFLNNKISSKEAIDKIKDYHLGGAR